MGVPVSFVKDSNSATVWLYGPVAYTGIRSPYHLNILMRVAKQSWDKAATDPMLQAEMDIAAAYFRAVGALPAQPVTISIADAQVAELKAALIAAVPQHLSLSMTGDAHA